jgi:hypothetical protein
MSDDLKVSNGAPELADGEVVDQQNQPTTEAVTTKGKSDTVAYETYKKVLATAKKREQELEVERAEKQKLLEEKLQVEGKKDELIESYKKKYSDLESKFKKSVGSFAANTLSQAISLEASKDGCIDTAALLKLVELNSDMIDDDFNVSGDSVKELVEKGKKDFPFLFQKTATAAKTGTPKNGASLDTADWRKLPLIDQAMMVAQGFQKK